MLPKNVKKIIMRIFIWENRCQANSHFHFKVPWGETNFLILVNKKMIRSHTTGCLKSTGQSNLPLRDRNMQVKISLKIALKSWDGCIYENVSQISLSLKQLQKYDCFFPVNKVLFCCKVWLFWQFWAMFWKQKPYLSNRLSERDLAYIFINATISSFQGNL